MTFHTYTPNGKRETHTMAIESTQQSLDNDEDDTGDSIIIPRVNKTEMKTTNLIELTPAEFHHYDCPKKITPPYNEDHQGIPFQDVVKVNKDIKAALQLDAEWFSCERH